eukprot:26383_1
MAPFSLEIYRDKLLPWVSILLFALNGVTGLITAFNLLYLYKKFPKVKNRGWNLRKQQTTKLTSPHALLIDQKESSDTELMKDVRFNRVTIQVYFYIVSSIPFGVSCICHLGVIYPLEAIWVFPAMNILIASAYLSFIQMMIMSCDGLKNLKKYLIEKPDECASKAGNCLFKRCLQSNAAEGALLRGRLCILIVVKPILNYITAYFQYFHGDEMERTALSYILKVLTMFTTFIPIQAMKSFHLQLLPYTRMRRSVVKRNVVSFLSPICQLQEVVVTLLFNIGAMYGFKVGEIGREYRWIIGYGLLLTFEMLICSILIVWYAFRPQDLRLWQYHESLLKKHESKLMYNEGEVTDGNSIEMKSGNVDTENGQLSPVKEDENSNSIDMKPDNVEQDNVQLSSDAIKVDGSDGIVKTDAETMLAGDNTT